MSSPGHPTQSPSPSVRRADRGSGFSGWRLRLVFAGAIVLFSVVIFFSNRKSEVSRITGKRELVDISVKDEIVLGLQGVRWMGPQSLNQQAQSHVDRVGYQLVEALQKLLNERNLEMPVPFEFHLLADLQTINTFALPGGQVFVTEGLYRQLSQDGQLAGLLGHEMGHVLQRHGSQRLVSSDASQRAGSAMSMAGGDLNSARAAAWIGNLVKIKYGREDELEADRWGIQLMVLAGYSPENMMVLDFLDSSAGGGAIPGLLTTHARPANRRKYFDQIIEEQFPNGLPANLQ